MGTPWDMGNICQAVNIPPRWARKIIDPNWILTEKMINLQSQKGRALSIVQLRVTVELVLPGDGTNEVLF